MFATIRQTFPSTRTMTDGRLTAIVGAAMLLLLSLADADIATTAGIVAGAVAVVVGMRCAGATHRAETAADPAASSVVLPPRAVRAESTSAPVLADDVLLARAIALRDRVSVRR